mgnify:CR=1 FL=1
MNSVAEVASTPEGQQQLREELYALLARRRLAVLEHAAGVVPAEDDAPSQAGREPAFDHLERRIAEHLIEQTPRSGCDRTRPGEAEGSTATAGLGARVAVRWEDGVEETFTIVEPVASDPRRGWISTESPIGRGLLGCRPGERVAVAAPGGDGHLVVLAVM